MRDIHWTLWFLASVIPHLPSLSPGSTWKVLGIHHSVRFPKMLPRTKGELCQHQSLAELRKKQIYFYLPKLLISEWFPFPLPPRPLTLSLSKEMNICSQEITWYHGFIILVKDISDVSKWKRVVEVLKNILPAWHVEITPKWANSYCLELHSLPLHMRRIGLLWDRNCNYSVSPQKKFFWKIGMSQAVC